MKKIKSLRKDIDLIHTQIFKLVLKRIEKTQEIKKIKNSHNLKFIDTKREFELIHMFDQDKKIKSNPELKKMIQKIQKNILTENKKYLKKTANAKI